jgi:LysM repeat protein
VKKLLLALLCVSNALPAAAQSLRGSQASVQKMYTRAVLNDLEFLRTSKSVYESVRDKELVLVPITMDMTLERVSYPFVIKRTLDVVTVFAQKYRAACGERLVITSAARPRANQPRNASPQSVHPTGMAIDFRKPPEPCLSFMRNELLALERQGILEATEERRPPHFHVAVLQRGRFAPATPAIAAATTAAPAQAAAPTTIAATPASVAATGGSATTDSASGTVEVAEKPEDKPVAKPAASGSGKSYTVKKGDNLSVIAKRFGLTVSRLKSLNGMKGSAIKPGQKLRVG